MPPKKKYAIVRHYESLGAYLREMRVDAGLNQGEVAKALGYQDLTSGDPPAEVA